MKKCQIGRYWSRIFFLILGLVTSAAFADTSIRISGSSWIHDAPTRLADQSGYFTGAGQDITVTYEASGQASLQSLLDGQVEFALAAATPVARALLERSGPDGPLPDDLLVLGTISLSNQTHHLLAPRERGIDSPEDLKGRRIALLKGSSAEYFWSLFAPVHGIPVGSVELVDMPKEDMAESLRDGHVDALITWDPWIFRFERDLDMVMVSFTDRQVFSMNWLLVTQRKHLDHYPGAAQDILKGYIRAINGIHADPDAGVLHPDDSQDLPRDYVRSMERRIIYNVGLNWSILIDIERQFDWLLGRGESTASMRPEPDQYLEPGPLWAVAPERVLLPDIWQRGDVRP